MLFESDLIPFTISPPVGNRSVVLAPHPDDETLGCGGTIRLLLNSKKDVKVVFLTSGDKADPSDKLSQKAVSSPPQGLCDGMRPAVAGPHISEYARLREEEAVRALAVLGVSDYMFLRFPDRELGTYYDNVLNALWEVLRNYSPDALYSPSVVELNPDHRTTAAIALDLQKMSNGLRDGPLRVVFYEVTTPVRPNVLVDVTSVFGVKKKAVLRYQSQLNLSDYLGHITAMNTIRALTVKNQMQVARPRFLRRVSDGPGYVEAFWSLGQLPDEETIMKWLSFKASVRSI